MAQDQFMIAPFRSGQQDNVKPFLIPEDAFEELRNAYVYRGRVRKRVGSQLITPGNPSTAGFEQLVSRLRANLGTTDGSGNISGTVPGWTGSVIGTTGQMFSIGNELFTVYQTGTPANMLTNSAAATTFTFNTTTGAYNIQGSLATTSLYYYSSLPVMGFVQYENSAINDEPTYAFDTRMAYRYSTNGWERLSSGSDLWTQGDSNFFWSVNYRGSTSNDTLLFVTNNSATDNVRYWDGSTSTWTTFKPQYTATATDTIEGCRLIVHFKNRLIFLNTWESDGGAPAVNFPSRIRFCQNGSPLETDAWQEGPETKGKGGWLEADTKEAIISAKILRDRLIVFFERSTWELVYTGNKVLPFIFQRINSELGVESQFSTVLFDKDVLGVGNVGIHSCNGANVVRIDDKIPDKVFRIHNGSDGVERVAGIRDYYTELVYWSIPSDKFDTTYPDEILVYNYKNGSWAVNDDTITAFGYIQNLADETWQDDLTTWAEDPSPWNSGQLQSEFRRVVAGNQQGYTFILDVDTARNSEALQITNLANSGGTITVTSINHNIRTNDFVAIENVIGATTVDGIYQVQSVLSDNTFTINEPSFLGSYEGGGTIARVSKIDILTKQFNFYFKSGDTFFVPKVDFYVDRTSAGEIQIDFFTSTNASSMTADGIVSGAILGTNVLETYPYPSVTSESFQERLWHAMYPQADGDFVQLRLFLNGSQMKNETIAFSDFQLHAISFHASRASKV